ncbi:RluA family pseudouridine synthase [Candidatus Bipolaricaulota bacterium]|nr:RluA family pseudouridine synthase [Candidatus Bipolaricaulota bacterium]
MNDSDLVLEVDETSAGTRLDQFLSAALPQRSRTELKRLVLSAQVEVNGSVELRPSHRVRPGDCIRLALPDADQPILTPRSLPIPIPILYEDDQFLVVDKPLDLVVHPGTGTTETTLVEALLVDRDLPTSDDPARPGIVHRLDRETSGVLVVAKTAAALEALQRQFAERTVIKHYIAVVEGTITEDEGLIDAPIGRDVRVRRRMAVQPAGRAAVTRFRVLDRAGNQTLLLVAIDTGRTHQIRVHMRYIGHPVCGDSIYGHSNVTQGERLLLHAWRLQIASLAPSDQGLRRFEAPIPEQFPTYPYEEIRWPEAAGRF